MGSAHAPFYEVLTTPLLQAVVEDCATSSAVHGGVRL